MAFGTILLNNRLAQRRAEHVIGAVHQHRSKYGRYPARLSDVAPEFISSIPKAKVALAFNEFTYLFYGDRPMLMYVAIPPFARRIYSFDSGRWGSLD